MIEFGLKNLQPKLQQDGDGDGDDDDCDDDDDDDYDDDDDLFYAICPKHRRIPIAEIESRQLKIHFYFFFQFRQ